MMNWALDTFCGRDVSLDPASFEAASVDDGEDFDLRIFAMMPNDTGDQDEARGLISKVGKKTWGRRR